MTSFPQTEFELGHWLSILLAVPIISLVFSNKKEASAAEPERGRFTFLGNEVFRKGKPVFLTVALCAVAMLTLFVGSAQRLSEQANDNHWKHLLDSHPRFADGYRRWAYDLWVLKNNDEAQTRVEEALAIDPKNYKAWLVWGKVLGTKYQYGPSAEKFQKAAEYAPRDAALYLSWGYALERAKKKEEAVEKFRKVLELHPDETTFIQYASERIDYLQTKR